jgi:hypothetical protein
MFHVGNYDVCSGLIPRKRFGYIVTTRASDNYVCVVQCAADTGTRRPPPPSARLLVLEAQDVKRCT